MAGLPSQIAYGSWQKIHHGHYLTTVVLHQLKRQNRVQSSNPHMPSTFATHQFNTVLQTQQFVP